MKAFTVALTSLLLHASIGTSWAIPGQGNALSAQADAYALSITSADQFLIEVDQTLAMAREGDYGSISGEDLQRLDVAHLTIVRLLDGYDNARHLQPDERIALFNAQELIKAIVRNDEKGRVVCKRVAGTGTRLARAECLTVVEREMRAQTARRDMLHIQHGIGD
jgi:hypothetical protein